MDSTANGVDETLAGDAEDAEDGAREVPARAQRGTAIGRYVVLEELGAGAMGVVYAAYDPELDRKVAVKLVHAAMRDPVTGYARLLREAQALARVVHPNVVTVHDVGSVDGQVFVAMEFVQGVTLARWLATPRPWQAALDALIRAGRGLAAVHAAGLIHRDFKPENVMLGDDGRVLVMDFGLARAGAEPDGPREAVLETSALAATGVAETQASGGDLGGLSRPGGSSLELRLTRTGALLGTPAYMAPELYFGRGADARSDQFSQCVALYEALYGQRPHEGMTALSIAAAASAGQVRAPPAGSRVPRWVHRAVVRGLDPRPEQRWPEVAALLAALARDPGRRRRQGLAIAGIVVGLGAAGYVGTRAAADTCSGGAREVAGVWDEARREAAARAFAATGLPYAARTWSRVAADLDAHAGAWAAMHREACEAHRRGEQSNAVLDLRMTCLEGQLRETAALIEVLVAADATTVENAAMAGEQIDALARCADLAGLASRVAPPADPARVVEVERVRGQLARAYAEEQTGRYEVGRELARATVVAANATGYPPVIAEAELRAGNLARLVGDDVDARERLQSAHFAALAARHEPVAITTALELAHVLSTRETRLLEAENWVRTAEALLAGTGPDDPAWLDLLIMRGSVHHDAGRLAEGERAYREALARAARIGGAASLRVATVRNNLGILAWNRGEMKAARGEYDAALAIYEAELGEGHPQLIEPLANLSNVAVTEGALGEAGRLISRLQAIAEQAFPADSPRLIYALALRANVELTGGHADAAVPLYLRVLALMRVDEDHIDRAVVHNNLGNAMQQLGRFAEAEGHYERALKIRQRAHGAEHPGVASVLSSLGALYDEMGRRPSALMMLRRALALQERLLGRDHPDLGYTLTNLGDIEGELGDPAGAEHLQRAVTIWERSIGADNPLLVHPLTALGELLIAGKRPGEAAALLERALALDPGAEPAELAERRFLLARALWSGDRARALALAREAAPLVPAAATWLSGQAKK